MEAVLSNTNAFQNMGWIFMISESVPVVAMFLVIVHFEQGKMSWTRALLVLLALFVVQIGFAGLRGSRSQTVQFLFWLVGCIHFIVRPVPRKVVYAGSVFVMLFLYIYGFYKAAGANGVSQALSGSEQRSELSRKSRRTFDVVVLGDLGRSDVQAFVLYRLMNDKRDFQYAKGRTYLSALSILVPSFLWHDKPASKLKEGTDIQAGAGSYVPAISWSSRVYGLSGEAMLNFGPVSVPLVYALFGLLVGWARSWIARLLPGDARLLLAPFLIYECFSALSADLDNLIFGLIKDGFVPFMIVLTCSVKRKPSIGRLVPPTLSTSAPSAGRQPSLAMRGGKRSPEDFRDQASVNSMSLAFPTSRIRRERNP